MGICSSVPADVDYSYFKIGKELGKGGFGKVHIAIRNHDRKKHAKDFRYEYLALKRISKARLLGIDKNARSAEENNTDAVIEADKIAAMMLWMERAVMVLMRSPYTVKLHHAFQTPEELVLVMPCYSGGDIHNHLQKGTMSEDEVRIWAAELLEGIAHIHSYHFVFRDIKPLNLLIDSEGHLAITDFGLCRLLEAKNGYTIIGRGGTRGYRSPEAAAGYAYDFSCDFFSFGVTLYEMATGRRKVQSLHPGFQLSSNDAKANARLSPEFKDLIRRLTLSNPTDRLGCELSTKRMIERCYRLGLSIHDFNGNPTAYQENLDSDELYPNEIQGNSGKHFDYPAQSTVLTIDSNSPGSSDTTQTRGSVSHTGMVPSTPSNARPSGNYQPYHSGSGRASTSEKATPVDGWQYRSLDEIDADNNFHWNAVRKHVWFRPISWDALPRRGLKPPFVPQIQSQEFYVKNFEANPAPTINDDTRALPTLIERQQDLFNDFEFNIDATNPIDLSDSPPFTVAQLTDSFIPSSHHTGAPAQSENNQNSSLRNRSISISQSTPSLNCSTYSTSRYDSTVGVSTNGLTSRQSISTPKQTFRPTPSTMVPHIDDDTNEVGSQRKAVRGSHTIGSLGSISNPNLMAGKMQG